MKSIFITTKVLDSIKNTLCNYPAECGGIIACNPEWQIVDYYFDKDAGVGNNSFCPTGTAITEVVNKYWHPQGMLFGGIAHSHPVETLLHPSKEDLHTAQLILEANHQNKLVLIITQVNEIKAWEVHQGCAPEECLLIHI